MTSVLARVVSVHFDERPHEWRCVYDSRGHARLVADILTPPPQDSPAWVRGHRTIIVSERPYDPAHAETTPMLLVAVGTAAGDTVGAAYFRDVDHGTVTGWITANPQRLPQPPELAFSAQGWHVFPDTAVVGEERLRTLVTEYLETGRRPEHVRWQESEFIR